VAIVNAWFARHYWPGENPIGKRITLDNVADHPRWLTIVGVSRDAAQTDLANPMEAELYLPFLQQSDYLNNPSGHFEYMTFVLRRACPTDGRCDASTSAPLLRRAITDPDHAVAVSEVQTMDAVVREASASRRFYLVLLIAFAVVALALAAVGIYGVTSYAMSRRTKEIGLRIALGATPDWLLMRVIGDGMRVVLVGTAIGAVSALLLGRLLSGILFGVSARDPVTFLAVGTLLGAVAVVACYLPARRAMRIEPVRALRAE
jgi:putative ABC transport system permease protein